MLARGAAIVFVVFGGSIRGRTSRYSVNSFVRISLLTAFNRIIRAYSTEPSRPDMLAYQSSTLGDADIKVQPPG